MFTWSRYVPACRRLFAFSAAAVALGTACTLSPASAQAAATVVAAPGEVVVIGNLRCTIGLTGLVSNIRYAVTAGHCYKSGGNVLDKNGNPLGQFESYRPDQDDHYGFGLIRLFDNVAVSASIGNFGLSSIDFAPKRGQQLCKQGYRTGLSCGTVMEATSKHIYITPGMRDDHGDSGGVVYRRTPDGQAAFIGMVMGYRSSDHAAVVEPAKWLFQQIKRYGPTKNSPFTWYRVA